MKNKKNEHINFEDSIPELNKIKKENPFAVPEGYFDSLPTSIQEKIESHSHKLSIFEQILTLFKQPKYSVTAVLTIAILIVVMFVFIKPSEKETPFFSDITIDDIINEYPEFIYDLDESTIIEILYAENGQDTYDFFENDIYTDTTITDDDIIEYLEDENVETELIYNL